MKAHFVAEKRREDRLRRHLDGFARWDWHDAVGVTGLDSILAARLPRVRPREESMLLTLATHPRTLPRTSSLRNTPPDAECAAARRRRGQAKASTGGQAHTRLRSP